MDGIFLSQAVTGTSECILDETCSFTSETFALVTLKFHANIMEPMLISQARDSKDTIGIWA